MINERLASQLRSQLGANNVLTSPEELVVYSFDGTAELNHRPLAIVYPSCTDSIVKVVQLADAHDVSITTRGSGTGLSGGSVPCHNSIVLCLNRMDRMIELDEANLTLTVEPGLTTKQISELVESHGLFYPPDPSSMKISTIGGNVANNSGGLRGLKYGVTRDYVMGLEVVLANGEVIWLGNKCVKDVAGYSLKDLFVGSEGTLGIITKILLKLVPKPATKRTLLAIFDSMEDAAATVSSIISSKMVPCTLEFIDRFTLQSVEAFAQIGLPKDCEAVLLMESDGHPAQVEEDAVNMEKIARENHARDLRAASSAAEAEALAQARRSAFAAVARIRPTTILEDITVPRDKLVDIVKFVQATAIKYNLTIANFGHFGDGNLHPTILTDERDKEEMSRVHQALDELFKETIRLGGTITGEHGVGLAKKAYLNHQYKDHSFDLLQQLKRTFDPSNRLNPGKIFDV